MRSGYDAYRAGTRVVDKVTSLMIRGGFHDFGRKSVIAHPVRLDGAEHIAVGSGVYIGAASWLQVIDGTPDQTRDRRDPVIDIGDNVLMSGMCVISATASITIETGALLARNVYVADHGHAFTGTEAVRYQGIDAIAPVRIGPGCWLGQNVVVLPGADIGAGSVIGANSVVGGVIPDRTIAVGAPARVVRSIDD